MKPHLFFSSVLSIFLFSLFLFPLSTSAQVGLGLGSGDVTVNVVPENPGPNQRISVQLESFSFDLNSATITWNVNGKKMLSGKGDTQILLTTGKIGQKTTLSISIASSEGTVQKTFTITPASVDLIWEADTYTPPFFKGKPLFSMQSNVAFIAVPHIMRNGVEISSANLVYKWANNGTVFGSQSGYGKNTLIIAGSLIPRPLDITVEATDPVSGGVADGEAVLTPQTPLVLLYKNDPLYGVEYEKVLTGAYPLVEAEVNVTAVPYYFSAHGISDPAMTYTWELNGVPLNDGANNANKVFRKVGNVSGTSEISVSVSQNNTMFQTAKQNLMINFTNSTGQTSL